MAFLSVLHHIPILWFYEWIIVTGRFLTISKFPQYVEAERKQSVFVRLKKPAFLKAFLSLSKNIYMNEIWWVLHRTYRTAVSASKGHEIYRHLKKRACAFGVKSSK